MSSSKALYVPIRNNFELKCHPTPPHHESLPKTLWNNKCKPKMIYLYRENCREKSCDFRIAGRISHVFMVIKHVHIVKKAAQK